MQITFEIPDDLAASFVAAGRDPSRAALEALAVEGYREDTLSEFEIRQMLGLGTRMEVHAFLKEHGAFLHYSLVDLEQDAQSSAQFREKKAFDLQHALACGMIVVADTTPLNYLVLIREVHILSALYGRVLIPPAVRQELEDSRSPQIVRSWIAEPPPWLEVHRPMTVSDPILEKLDAGERQAIMLAQAFAADQFLVDEIRGRREGERRGVRVVGTVGIIKEAGAAGLLDITEAISKLRQTSFHIAPSILNAILGQSQE